MKIFSFDAKTVGLCRKPFAIAAIVYENGIETARFFVRRELTETETRFAKTQVFDNFSLVENITVCDSFSCVESYETMLTNFANFYKTHKQDAECICHMGTNILEAYILREMHKLGMIDDSYIPYPLYDVSNNLQQAGENPVSVDEYAKKYKLKVTDYGTIHNPLYDSEVAAKVYMHLNNNLKLKK